MKLINALKPRLHLLVYGALTLLILGPLILPGYILALDMIFAPELKMPDQISSSYVFYALLHVLDIFLPADLIQKLMLVAIFFLAGLGTHKLVLSLDKSRQLPAYFAGLLYVANPFTYERLMTGQYLVLFGYALLPWFARSVLTLLQKPSWRHVLVVVAWAMAVSIVSSHSVGMALIIAALAGGVQLWHDHRNGKKIKRLALYVGSALLACLAAASYWLLPILAGVGQQAQTISGIGAGDRAAFATGGVNAFERLANVLGLQGFWAERYSLFTLPQNGWLPTWLWALAVLALVGLVVIGAISWWKRDGKHSQGRAVVLVFGGCVVIGAFLASGIGNEWMARHIPLYAGYREPQKFVALVALGYAVLSAKGVEVIIQKLAKISGSASANIRTRTPVALALLLLLPVALTPTIWWAANNQLRAVQYPDSWYAANQQLNQDHDDFKVLALPWHLYMFVDFAGRTVANPARNFFDKPVIISDDSELAGVSLDSRDPTARQINTLLQTAPSSQDQLGKQLAALNIKYIILAKTSDYKRYDYLTKQQNLKQIADYPEVRLYKINNF